MLRPRLLSCALLLASAAAVLSCGRAEERAPDGRIVIDYWEKWTNFERDAMAEVVDLYNASQDRVFVRFVSTSQIDRKLLLATAGGDPPDVAGFWSHSVFLYAEKGALEPLDHLMERDGLSTADYVPSIIDGCQYRGFTWGLPSTPATIALHYNRGLFQQAGLDPDRPPRDIAELDAFADRLTKTGPDGELVQMGFVPTDPGWWGAMIAYWFGAELVSEDGRELLCDSPEMVAAFRWVQGFMDRNERRRVRLFEAAHRGEFASSSNSFMSGRVAMKLQGVWMANFIEEYGPDIDWAVAPFPAVSADMDPVTIVECDMLVIPRGASHVEEAWDFIKFVQRRENMERLCLSQRKFSPLADVSEAFYDEHPNPFIRLFRELAESPGARAVPKTPIWWEYRDELGVALDRVWVKGDDPAAALADVKARIQPKLDKANHRWDLVAAKRLEEWSQR